MMLGNDRLNSNVFSRWRKVTSAFTVFLFYCVRTLVYDLSNINRV